MDFGKLFSRAWDIIWKFKFLILLGVLAALGGSSGASGNQSRYVFNGGETPWNEMPGLERGMPFQNLDLSMLAIIGVIVLVILLILIGLGFWVVGAVSRGGLISAVNDIEEDNPTNFSAAFKAGWKKGWRLLGIALIPSIPGFVLLVGGILIFVFYGGASVLMDGNWPYAGLGPFLPFILLFCLLLPVILFLSILSSFANRACMLEDLGVIASYSRGFKVLADNLGSALLLYLIQVVASIGLFIVLFIPGVIMALCCFLWPVLILVQGAFSAYISTLWTLAWREFVGEAEIVPAEA